MHQRTPKSWTKTLLILIGSVILFAACNPVITTSLTNSYPTLHYEHEVKVIPITDPNPETGELIGSVKIGESGFTTHCDYETVLNAAKTEARKAGGNVLKITQHKTPDFVSTCHTMKADIYKIDNFTLCAPEPAELQTPDTGVARLHVYRPSAFGFAVSYNLHLNDSVICRVRPRWKQTIDIPQPGSYTIWAKTEARKDVTINIEAGHHYYLKCNVNMGLLVGRPQLDFIAPLIGKEEYDEAPGGKK